MAPLVFGLWLVALILLPAVQGGDVDHLQCTNIAIPSHPPGHLGVLYSELTVNGHVSIEPNEAGKVSPFFNGSDAPDRFRLRLGTANAHEDELLSGSIQLNKHSNSSEAHLVKSWSTTGRHMGYRHQAVAGRVQALFNSTSGQLCGKVCLHTSSRHFNDCQEALLSLKYPAERSLDDFLVRGRLWSLSSKSDPSYFSPLSLTGIVVRSEFPRFDYKFTQVKAAEKICAANIGDNPAALTMPKDRNSTHYTISLLRRAYLHIRNCSDKACGPFGGTDLNHTSFGGSMSLSFRNLVFRDEDWKIFGFLDLQQASNDLYNSDESVLAVEGVWRSGQFCMVACKTFSSTKDCSIQVTLRLSSQYDIHHRSLLVGSIGSGLSKSDPLYFEPLSLEAPVLGAQTFLGGQKYTYSKVEQAKQHCQLPVMKNSIAVYPDGSYPQDFWFTGTTGKKELSISISPVSIGSRIVSDMAVSGRSLPDVSVPKAFKRKLRSLNVSFEITFFTRNGEDKGSISAEGFYDPTRGLACLIGCKAVNSGADLEQGKDCNISISIQYPPISRNISRSRMSANVASLRKKGDALYFKKLEFFSSYHPFYTEQASESLWMQDLEVFLSILTLSLVVIALIIQLIHCRRQPKSRPYASLVMIFILILGHMVPLVLNFEAVFSTSSRSTYKPLWLSSRGAFLQVNEVAIRVMDMAALLLLLWLLQVVWTSRLSLQQQTSTSAERNISTSVSEKPVLLACAPLYIAGVAAVSLRQWLISRSLWAGLKAYAGLSLDLFLLPQVLAYSIWGLQSGVAALSPAFYTGLTTARLIPHVYDSYRVFKGAGFAFSENFYFADPDWDFFSLAWDIGISLAAVLMALLLFLQQRYGGRCFIPGRLYHRLPQEEQEQGS